MPLRKGKSRKVLEENIAELIRSYKRTGRIGTSKPKSMEEARKQAVAIAFAQRRKSK